jgi:hypothetical protein
MASEAGTARRVPPFIDPPGYSRHRPEETLLYRLVEEHYPVFAAEREAAGRALPKHVREEFEVYLKSSMASCACAVPVATPKSS